MTMPFSQPTAEADSRPLVLVVDDIAENRSAVCRRLERMGYRYFAVEGGRAAMAALDTERPDLVLLDYMMPDMSGIDVLNEMRQRSGLTDLPVIMLTARTDPETVAAALGAGANDYVTKPIDFVVLQARMEKQLQSQRDSQQLQQVNVALDRRVSVRAIEADELREQLANEIARRKELEAELRSAQSVTVDFSAPETGMTPPHVAAGAAQASPSLVATLRRLDMLATRLATAPAGAPVNLAALTEISALAREALDSVADDGVA